MKAKRAYVQLLGVASSDGLALVAELVEEEEAAEAVAADEGGEAEEGEGGDAAEGELGDGVVRAGVEVVAVGAGEDEMGEGGDDDGEGGEDEPGEESGPCIGLVDAEPFEPGSEIPELVHGVGRGPVQSPALV